MIFTNKKTVYVKYSTGITNPFTEKLTISKYENDLLYFKEKTDFYAVECHSASFYGYSNTMAGKVIITEHKWQLPLASAAEMIRNSISVKPIKSIRRQPAPLILSFPDL